MFIKAPLMRVITEEGENLGELTKEQALQIAREREEDLVLINPSAEPPIAKIISWSKFKYEYSKKKRAQKGSSTEVKEMRFNSKIEAGDIEHKLKRVQEFIDDGNKVKLHIVAKGRRREDPNKVKDTAKKVFELAQVFSIMEGEAKKEGYDIVAIVKPKK
jgi:translation initiation factor IF-3